MTTFHRINDVKIINDNIDSIIKKSKQKEIELLEPTIKEYKNIMKYIENFIIR